MSEKDVLDAISASEGRIIKEVQKKKGGSPMDYVHPTEPDPVPQEVLTPIEKAELEIFLARQKWCEENGAPICELMVRFKDGTIKEVQLNETIPDTAIRGVRVFTHINQVGFECDSCKLNYFWKRCNKNVTDKVHPEWNCENYKEIHAVKVVPPA